MEEKEKKNSVNPISKIAMGIVLVLGAVMILVETGLPGPDRSQPERPAEQKQILLQTDTAPAETMTVQKETLPTETEAKPTEPETIPPSGEITPSVAVSGSDGPVEYEILRWDRSYVNAEGKKQMTYYLYVFSGEMSI